MGPNGVVFSAPFFNEQSGFFEADEPFLIQAFFSEAAIEAFDMAVLRWFSRIDEVQFDLIQRGPLIQLVATEFGTVVNVKQTGLPMLIA